MTQREKILIVDDEADIRRLLRQIVSSAGYGCLEASGAEEALGLFKNNAVDMALVDINMPGRSGTELLSDLVNIYPDTAIIMVTAISQSDTCIECMHQGASDYVTKPFNHKELLVKIEQALEKRRLKLDNKEYQQHLEERVEEQAVRIRAAFYDAVKSLARALEAKDKYTSGHSQRVAEISSAIARRLGMPEVLIEKIQTAALVHDIGKIGVSESVLNKSEKLTEEEYCHVCLHCEMGERILRPITQDDEILSMVRHHHERYDGKGYPDGISGASQGQGVLPFHWSIIALADAYDAMTSDRSYRKALPPDQALQEIKGNTGSQFDPVVVDAFIKINWAAKDQAPSAK